jgi:hypothetical protein
MNTPESSRGPKMGRELTTNEVEGDLSFHDPGEGSCWYCKNGRRCHTGALHDYYRARMAGVEPDEYAEATNAAMNYGDGYANALQELAADMGRRLIPGVHYSREWIIEVINEFGRNRP